VRCSSASSTVSEVFSAAFTGVMPLSASRTTRSSCFSPPGFDPALSGPCLWALPKHQPTQVTEQRDRSDQEQEDAEWVGPVEADVEDRQTEEPEDESGRQ
jgi:hypothetical protein